MKSYFLTTALLAASCLSTPACSSPPSSVSTPASSAAPPTPPPQAEHADCDFLSARGRPPRPARRAPPTPPAREVARRVGIVLAPGPRRIEQAQVRMRDGARLNADVYL